MRLALLLPVLFSIAAPAYADDVRESRYGPTPPRQTTSAAARYDGPMLGWAGKPSTAALPPPTPQPAPLAAPTGGYQPARFSVAPAPAPTPTPAKASASLPASLYAPPRPMPVATAPAAPPQAALQQPAPQLALGPTLGGHFYSVARESGLTPDRIPSAGPDHRVLIASDTPVPPPEDTTPVHGSADWLAAGVDGDDDQDSASDRHAKTRNQDQ
jgi:hypothetical protein